MYYQNESITMDLDQILHHNIVFSHIPQSPFSMRLITYLYIKLSHGNEELNPQLVICNNWNMAITAGNFEPDATTNLENTLSKNHLHITSCGFVWRFPHNSSKWGCYAQNPCLIFLRFISIYPQIKTQIKVFLCGMHFRLKL